MRLPRWRYVRILGKTSFATFFSCAPHLTKQLAEERARRERAELELKQLRDARLRAEQELKEETERTQQAEEALKELSPTTGYQVIGVSVQLPSGCAQTEMCVNGDVRKRRVLLPLFDLGLSFCLAVLSCADCRGRLVHRHRRYNATEGGLWHVTGVFV